MNTEYNDCNELEIICLDGTTAHYVDNFGGGIGCDFREFEELSGRELADLDRADKKCHTISVPGHQFRFEVNRVIRGRRNDGPI